MSKARDELKSLREKGGGELREELLSLRRGYFNLRMQHAQQSSKTSELKKTRRSIARVLTVIGEQKRSAR